jgi:hypothetical protein
MAKKVMCFSFRYDEWVFATSLEIMAVNLDQGNQVKWVDWTGKFQHRFEFPIADRLHIYGTRRRIRKLNLIKTLSNLGVKGQFEFDNQIPFFTHCQIDALADEVAYLELISILRESAPNKKDHIRALSDFKKTFQFTYSAAIFLLTIERPSAVYIYNGRFLQERAVWEACIALSIPVVFFEKFNPNWVDRYFLFEKPTHSPNYRSQVMSDFGDALSQTNSEELLGIGTEWFHNRYFGKTQKFTKNQTFESNLQLVKPYYVFFHSSEGELITTDLTSGIWGNQISALNALVESVKLVGGFDLVIRMHPNLLYKSKREIKVWNDLGTNIAKENSWVRYISPESPISSYALIEQSEGVITVGSTIGVEASFMSKKSILLGRAFHEDMGITQNPGDRASLEALIASNLSREKLENCKFNSLKYAYFHAVGGTPLTWVARMTQYRGPFYKFGNFTIQRNIIVSLIMRLEVLIRKLLSTIQSS